MSQQTSESVLREGSSWFGSSNFRTFFLLQFTKELIKQSGPTEVFELKNILEKEDKGNKIKKELPHTMEKEIKDLYVSITSPGKKQIWKKEKLPLLQKKEIIPRKPVSQVQRPMIQRRSFSRALRIPEPKLPLRFQYLRPTPTSIQIDLDKLNPLIKDPMVNSIECNGENENIVVKGNMGTKNTNIILDKQEIDEVIKKFSETAKIPIHEGIFRVAIGKLILSAIISDVISSKFIIKKMMYAPSEVFGQ